MRRIVTSGRVRWPVLGAMAMLLLAGCADDDKDTTADQVAPTTVNVLAGLNDQQDPNIVINENLPEEVSIIVGSTVQWRFAGLEPHSVTFFPAGRTPPPPGSDESLSAPSNPPATTYDGTSLVNSGLRPLGPDAAEPFRLTFPTVGQFDYACVIHPLMTGRVTVAGKGAIVDSQADINERADRELNMWLDEGRAAKAKLIGAAPKQVKSPDDDSVTWTYEMGVTTEHTDVQAFAPAQGEVRPGDRVTFVNNTMTPHTATFAGGGQVPRDPNDPAVVASSGPSPITLAATGGPFNTGSLPPVSPPNAPPSEAARSFTFLIPAAGEYPYVCVLHVASAMTGTIKVA